MNIRPFIAFTLLLLLTACGKPPLTKEEQTFVKAIQEQLQNLGDSDRVQDLHPGEWLKVCINPLGVNADINSVFIKGVGIRESNEINILNGTNTYANDEVWGLFFVYPDNNVEYYNIKYSDVIADAPEGCVDRNKARLKVLANSKNRGHFLAAHGKYSENIVYLRLFSQ